MEDVFNKALGNFINDFANGGAIRHFVDLGYTVDEITGKLDFPISSQKVAEIVYQYYLDSGMVSLDEPKDYMEKVSYVKEYGANGKTSLRKVVETEAVDSQNYIRCDFGRQMYRNQDGKVNRIPEMSQRMYDHINALPWPLQDVWVRRELIDG